MNDTDPTPAQSAPHPLTQSAREWLEQQVQRETSPSDSAYERKWTWKEDAEALADRADAAERRLAEALAENEINRDPNALRTKLAAAQAETAKLREALELIQANMQRIDALPWGYDGDCGAGCLAEDSHAIARAALTPTANEQ